MKNKITYHELARAEIQPNRDIVISQRSKGDYILTQMLKVNEEDRVTNVFLKNSTIVRDVDGLYNLRDALNVAITAIETRANVEQDWEPCECYDEK